MKKKRVWILLPLVAAMGLGFFFLQSPSHPITYLPKSSQVTAQGKNIFYNQPVESLPLLNNHDEKPTPVPTPSAPPNELQYEVSSTALSAADIVVPHGARVPAVLMDAGSPDDSPEVRNIMDGIAEEFAETIREAKRKNLDMQEAWEEARDTADARYRFFFGFDAFNAATLETAGEAADEATDTSHSQEKQ